MMIGLNWEVIGLVLISLSLFGTLFALLMWVLGHRKEGYTAFFVVAGVLVTLAGVAVIDWRAAVLALACFTASGTPMMIGSVAQYIVQREREHAAIRAEALRKIDDQA